MITDYIAAVLHELRNNDLTALLKEYVQFDGSLSKHDHLAIRKTFSGMVKLIYLTEPAKFTYIRKKDGMELNVETFF